MRYDSVSQIGLPTGLRAILRERAKPSKFELTYKLRGATAPADLPARDTWTCPAGETDKRKDEIDVSFTTADAFERQFSRSCTVEDKTGAPPIPAALHAKAIKCTSQVTSIEFDDGTTIEEWRMKRKGTLIEVSRKAPDAVSDRDAFIASIARPLVKKHGIRPVRAGMSEWGSTCPAP